MFDKKLIAVFAALLLPYCATNVSPREASPVELANATVSTSAVAVPSGRTPIRIPMLAIEVEITAEGVTPLGARIVFAPPKANSAFADLRVQPAGVDGFAYTIPDPRLVEVHHPTERHTEVLESARAFVFVPLLAAVQGLAIQPLAGTDQAVSRGGSFDVRALAEEVCSRTQSELPVCREILTR